MDNNTSDFEQFISFPSSALNLVERCVGSIANQWIETIRAKDWNNYTVPFFPSTIAGQLFKLHQLIGQNITPLNESFTDFELNQNCPALHSQSTIAHASLAVGTLAMLIHIILVFTINHGLVQLYGSCLLMSIVLTTVHSFLLFISSYITSSLTANLRFSNNLMLNETKSESLYELYCSLLDASMHYLPIAIHLCTLFALTEQYQTSKRVCERHILKTCVASKLRSVFRSRQSKQSAKPVANHYVMRDSRAKSPKLGSFKSRGQKRNFGLYRCNNNLRFAEEREPARPYRHLSTQLPLGKFRWQLFGPVVAVILPTLPVGIGICLSYSFGLEHWWNPAYGTFTCGSVGSCLSAQQLWLYLPLGVIFTSQIALIIVLHLQTKQTINYGQCSYAAYQDFEARFCMTCKLTGSQILVWSTAFVSNHVCLVTLWQLYAIFTGLQGLFVCVSFTFSRPFLEVVFKRNDPLSRLKLDNLVMQLPLGIVRSGKETGSTPLTSSAPTSGLSVYGRPANSSSLFSQKQCFPRTGARLYSPPRRTPLSTSMLNFNGMQPFSVNQRI